ncbi:MAG: helix-turn-helix domain-containing protein, partial [Anaerovoracaceae bacterium]
DLPPRITSSGKTISFSKLNGTLKEQTDMAQRSIIDHCLRQTGKTLEGKRAAAKLLGISESTLYRKMRELEM